MRELSNTEDRYGYDPETHRQARTTGLQEGNQRKYIRNNGGVFGQSP